MSVTVDVNSVILCKHVFAFFGDKAFNVLHYQVSSITDTTTGLPAAVAPTFVDCGGDIAEALWQKFYAFWKFLGSVDVNMESTTVQSIYPIPRSLPITWTSDPETSEGTVVGDPLPLQDTLTLLKKTDVGMRYGQGRIFVAGFSEAANEAGRATAPTMANMAGLGAALINPVDVISGPNTIRLRMVLAGSGPRVGIFLPVRTIITSDNLFKTQRRRRPGKGI